MDGPAALQGLGSSEKGLSDEEVLRRRERYGENKQERKSGQAVEKLRAMVHITATVIRLSEPMPRELPIEELVPGDLVHLSAGDMVPGDLRLIAAKDLFVNQASLTGEALPVEKHGGRLSRMQLVSVTLPTSASWVPRSSAVAPLV